MLLGFRTTTWFQRPLYILSSRFHSKFNITSSSSQLSQSGDSDGDGDEEFLPWLRAKSGSEISSVLSIGNSTHGRSLFASEFIQAGDTILKIPFSAHLTTDHLLPEINSLLSDDVELVSRLALVILIEQRKGKKSEWAPYISRLPKAGEMHSTIFWSKDELEMIRKSSLYKATIDQKAELEKEYMALRPALDRFPNIFKDSTFKDFAYAFALVASRAWGSSKEVSMIPFADFLNHNGVSEAMLLSDEDKKISEVIADQDYASGKQVLVRYGKYPNSALLLYFGFTLSYNIHDQVQIQMNVPEQDPLHTMKSELLHKHSSPRVSDTNNSDSSRNSFIIKEVRSIRGRGKGIPQSLRAFARVLCVDTFQELKDLELEAVRSDGRIARSPLENKSREIQSHQLLLATITHLIHDYEASIESLRLLNPNSTGGNFELRKQMAQDLLSGEHRILKSASAWLNNYCHTLSKEISAVRQQPEFFKAH